MPRTIEDIPQRTSCRDCLRLNGSTKDPSYDENFPLEKKVDPVIYRPLRHARQRGNPRYSSRKASIRASKEWSGRWESNPPGSRFRAF